MVVIRSDSENFLVECMAVVGVPLGVYVLKE